MKLLAIETSASACSLALLLNDEIIEIHQHAPMQQAQLILPLIEKLLHSASITLNQLDALAFGCGPGSFTGVRIATSVAQGLGFAAELALIPISSLAGLAQAAYEDLSWKKMLVAVDARINEIYWGAYVANAQGYVELINKECVCAPEALQKPMDDEWTGVGNAWDIYPLPYHPLQKDILRVPMAKGIVRLAKEKFIRGEMVQPAQALPTYLRDEVAKKS